MEYVKRIVDQEIDKRIKAFNMDAKPADKLHDAIVSRFFYSAVGCVAA